MGPLPSKKAYGLLYHARGSAVLIPAPQAHNHYINNKSKHPSIHHHLHPSNYPSPYMSPHPCLHPSIPPPIYSSTHPSMPPSIHPPSNNPPSTHSSIDPHPTLNNQSHLRKARNVAATGTYRNTAYPQSYYYTLGQICIIKTGNYKVLEY